MRESARAALRPISVRSVAVGEVVIHPLRQTPGPDSSQWHVEFECVACECYSRVQRQRPDATRRRRSLQRSPHARGVDDRVGERFRRFLGQVVPDTVGDVPVYILARELLRVGSRLGMRRAVGIAFERDGRHRDGRRAPWRNRTDTTMQALPSVEAARCRRPGCRSDSRSPRPSPCTVPAKPRR
ncbi:hypothetical protein OKW43_000826 [Paraburkholderia sp. WC7.3g]